MPVFFVLEDFICSSLGEVSKNHGSKGYDDYVFDDVLSFE